MSGADRHALEAQHERRLTDLAADNRRLRAEIRELRREIAQWRLHVDALLASRCVGGTFNDPTRGPA